MDRESVRRDCPAQVYPIRTDGCATGGGDCLWQGRRLAQLGQASSSAAKAPPTGETGATQSINPASDLRAKKSGHSVMSDVGVENGHCRSQREPLAVIHALERYRQAQAALSVARN